MYIDLLEGGIEVNFRARNWELAGSALAAMRANPPKGYLLNCAVLRPTSSGGKRCEMVVSFSYIDDRVEEIPHWRHGETFFAPYEAMAQGRGQSPPTSRPTTTTPIP